MEWWHYYLLVSTLLFVWWVRYPLDIDNPDRELTLHDHEFRALLVGFMALIWPFTLLIVLMDLNDSYPSFKESLRCQNQCTRKREKVVSVSS